MISTTSKPGGGEKEILRCAQDDAGERKIAAAAGAADAGTGTKSAVTVTAEAKTGANCAEAGAADAETGANSAVAGTAGAETGTKSAVTGTAGAETGTRSAAAGAADAISGGGLDPRITASECYRYAADVLSDDLTVGLVHHKVGVKVRQACKRFLDELEASKSPDYPWEFDIGKAYRPIDFIERFCTPTKGDYTRMTLLGWEHFVEGNIYGWVSKQTGLRRFREAVILVGSGNGKSTLVTGNAAFGICKDNERGAEVYCLANSKEQARNVFDECKSQINSSRALSAHLRVTRDAIYHDGSNSKIQPLSTESKNLDGRNVHLAIFDEIQEYTNYDLINVIKKKMKKRRQPLAIYISTFGSVIDGPLMDLYCLGADILNGSGAISRRVSDRVFVYIAEIDKDDDPDDVSCWTKANPSEGVLLLPDDLEDEWERCKLVPSERSDFINKQLNVFTSVDEMSFLDSAVILANDARLPPEELSGRSCYGGFDLSNTQDFTSAGLEFPLDDGRLFYLSHTWVPEATVRLNRQKLDWKALQECGSLTVVKNEFVNYELILAWFLQMRGLYRIECIGYDMAKAFQLVQAMQQEGLPLDVVRQGELTLTPVMDDLKEQFLARRVVTNGDRLYQWYLTNVRLTKRSAGGTYLPTKQNSNRKIDGFAAHLDAHAVKLRKEAGRIAPDEQVSRVIKLSR